MSIDVFVELAGSECYRPLQYQNIRRPEVSRPVDRCFGCCLTGMALKGPATVARFNFMPVPIQPGAGQGRSQNEDQNEFILISRLT
jgi:hypothetical protein